MSEIIDRKPESITTSRCGIVKIGSIAYGETGDPDIDNAGIVTPSSQVLDPDERQRREELYTFRALNGLELLTGEPTTVNVVKQVERQPRCRDRGRMPGPRPLLPNKRTWGSLKTLRCARCTRELLGPSEEPLRAAAKLTRMACVHRLPPPVAGYVPVMLDTGEEWGRPHCEMCFEHEK